MYLLLCITLVLAVLLAINLVASSVIGVFRQIFSRRALALPATTASRLFFILAIAPPIVGIIFVCTILIPAYIIHEPPDAEERIGIGLAVAALLSVIGITAAVWRVFGSWWTTRRLIREWLRDAEAMVIEGVTIPVFRVSTDFPVLAIVGAVSPKMFVASLVLENLNERELSAAFAHECGHLAARDNLCRILIRISRDLLVFPVWRSIERDWSETAETAADEHAARTNDTTALDLASALIKIARIVPRGGSASLLPSGTYLIAEDSELISRRVRRLVAIAGSGIPEHRSISFRALILVGSVTFFSIVIFRPDLFRIVHDMTERFVAAFQ